MRSIVILEEMVVAKCSREVGIPSGQRTMEESVSTRFQECNLNSNKVTVFMIATPALARESMANAMLTDPGVTSCHVIISHSGLTSITGEVRG
jgi:hypothetical protein